MLDLRSRDNNLQMLLKLLLQLASCSKIRDLFGTAKSLNGCEPNQIAWDGVDVFFAGGERRIQQVDFDIQDGFLDSIMHVLLPAFLSDIEASAQDSDCCWAKLLDLWRRWGRFWPGSRRNSRIRRRARAHGGGLTRSGGGLSSLGGGLSSLGGARALRSVERL